MANSILEGKKGIIFGALNEDSISWKAAEKIYSEGGRFVLTNIPLALRFGTINKLADNCQSEVIPADATSVDDLENLIKQSTSILGGKIDFILHTPAMSPNIRKNKSYGDLNYDWFLKTIDVSAMAFHKLLQTTEKLDAMNEWASIVAISYIAAQRTFPGYSDMAEAKAMLESIARSYGYRYAKLKKVRINTISQSPSKTTAASGISGFDAFYNYAQKMSPLGNADVSSCADYITMMFSDFTKMVTMQNLFHDGGFSSCGMTEDLIDSLK